MKKLLLILLAGYLLTLYGCPDPETDPPQSKSYSLQGTIHLFNGCSEETVVARDVKVSVSLIGSGDSKSKEETITLTPSSEDPDLLEGDYDINVNWEDSQGSPSKWGALIVKSTSGDNPCTYNCDTPQVCENSYADPSETDVDGTTTVRQTFYVSCFCEN